MKVGKYTDDSIDKYNTSDPIEHTDNADNVDNADDSNGMKKLNNKVILGVVLVIITFVILGKLVISVLSNNDSNVTNESATGEQLVETVADIAVSTEVETIAPADETSVETNQVILDIETIDTTTEEPTTTQTTTTSIYRYNDYEDIQTADTQFTQEPSQEIASSQPIRTITEEDVANLFNKMEKGLVQNVYTPIVIDAIGNGYIRVGITVIGETGQVVYQKGINHITFSIKYNKDTDQLLVTNREGFIVK